MRALFVLQKRYFQPRLGERDLLEIVEIFDLLLNTPVQNSVCQGEKTAPGPNLVRIGPSRETPASFQFGRNILAEFFDIHAGQIQLPHFFFQRHA